MEDLMEHGARNHEAMGQDGSVIQGHQGFLFGFDHPIRFLNPILFSQLE